VGVRRGRTQAAPPGHRLSDRSLSIAPLFGDHIFLDSTYPIG